MSRWHGLAFAVAGFIFCLGFGERGRADDSTPRVTVDDATFTLEIANRQPTQRVTLLTSEQQPYFWTLLSANAATLAALRSNGKLPIMHAWRRYIGPVELENADGILEGDIPLDLGTAALVDQLQYEIDHTPRRTFTWRTWSRKGALTPGVWSVFIKYADGSPVVCRVISGVGVPCVFRLKVRTP